MVIGGAGASTTYGNRIINFTDGTVNYGVFGGSNGTTGSDSGSYQGILSGSTLIYVGGSAQVGNDSLITNGNTLYGVESGSVFGAGNGTNEEIKEFCTLNYGVTFPMMAKISVKGKDIAPLYQWLTHKSENGVSDAKIGWNFHKFLIDENGRWVASIGSTTSPLSQEIVEWIEE